MSSLNVVKKTKLVKLTLLGRMRHWRKLTSLKADQIEALAKTDQGYTPITAVQKERAVKITETEDAPIASSYRQSC